MVGGSDFVPVLVRLMELYPDPLDAGTMPQPRSTHLRACHVGHGWYVRCQRTAQALRLLADEGFDAEAAPLRRTLTEHAVALRWYASVGAKILDPKKGHHRQRLERQRAAIEVSPGSLGIDLAGFTTVIGELDADTERDRSQDNLHAFTGLHALYWQDQLVTWHADTHRSHPTVDAAADYRDPGDLGRFLTESRSGPDGRIHAAVELFRATCSYADSFGAEPWRDELPAIARVLAGLGGEVAESARDDAGH